MDGTVFPIIFDDNLHKRLFPSWSAFYFTGEKEVKQKIFHE